jgi:hypothetical protein
MSNYGGFLGGDAEQFHWGEINERRALISGSYIYLDSFIASGVGIIWNTPSASFQQAAFFPIIMRYLAGYQ